MSGGIKTTGMGQTDKKLFTKESLRKGKTMGESNKKGSDEVPLVQWMICCCLWCCCLLHCFCCCLSVAGVKQK